VIGSSGVSLGLLLASYMGGLCLGSAFFARFAPAREHPLRIYAMLEAGIGVFGILALFLIPIFGRAYAAGPVKGTAGLVLRGVFAAVCLLPPTILMGASFPALSRQVRSAVLYSGNIAGAVVGCLLAGFYLLRVYDLGTATYSAAAMNFGAAAIAW